MENIKTKVLPNSYKYVINPLDLGDLNFPCNYGVKNERIIPHVDVHILYLQVKYVDRIHSFYSFLFEDQFLKKKKIIWNFADGPNGR